MKCTAHSTKIEKSKLGKTELATAARNETADRLASRFWATCRRKRPNPVTTPRARGAMTRRDSSASEDMEG